QRVVVILTDPTMARMLREAANVNLAVSIAVLSAPAFLAALYGDRVRTVVLARHHLLAVLDRAVAGGGPLAGLSVTEASARHRFCAIAVTDDKGHLVSETTLKPGRRLVIVAALPDVE